MAPTLRNTILSATIGCLMALGGCALHEDIDQISYEPGGDVNINNVNNAQDMQTDTPVVDDMNVDMAQADMPGPVDMDDMADMRTPDMQTPDMMTDAGDGTDMGEADMAPDMDEVSFGMTCPGVDTTPLMNDCDPVNDTTCPAGFSCSITLINQNPIEFGARCVKVDEPIAWTQAEGQECGPERCLAGLQCASGICRKFCQLADARGCASDEFCDEFNTATSEFGVCLPACNP